MLSSVSFCSRFSSTCIRQHLYAWLLTQNTIVSWSGNLAITPKDQPFPPLCDDPSLFGGSQLLHPEGGRPHGAFVEVRLSLKLNVAYLELNFCALWKKQRTLPSLA